MTRLDASAKPDPSARTGRSESGEITPIEALISQPATEALHEAAERAEDAMRRKSEPVHMDGLKPLPPELAGQRLPSGMIPASVDGQTVPLVPRMTRSIPKPFKRTRVDMDQLHHGKTWHYAPAQTLVPGDIVVDFGQVSKDPEEIPVRELVAGYEITTGYDLLLTNVIGKRIKVAPHEQLRVFRKPHEDETT